MNTTSTAHIDSLETLYTVDEVSHATNTCPEIPAGAEGTVTAKTDKDSGWLCSTCITVGGQLVGRLAEQAARQGVTARDDVDFRPWGNGEAGSGHGAPAANTASPKQLAFIERLVAEKGDAGADLLAAAGRLTGGRSGSASKLIDQLMSLGKPAASAAPVEYRWTKRNDAWLVTGPAAEVGAVVTITKASGAKVDARIVAVLEAGVTGSLFSVEKLTDAAPAEPVADVRPGHYAIPSGGHNDLVFYRVDRPETGKFAGRTFVKMIVGGKPDSNVARGAVAGILARIAADPDAAARYGQEIGRCCRCNRTLTDETSRALGIGPECRKAD